MAMFLAAADPEEEQRKAEEAPPVKAASSSPSTTKDGGEGGTTITNTNHPKQQQLCGVCHEHPSKYKCTRCLLPYCSLPCSATHKSTHPAPAPIPISNGKPKSPSPPVREKAPRPGTRAAAVAKSPFAGLDTSVALKELFAMYPRLGEHLESIHAATLPPVDGGEDKHNGGRSQQQQKRKKGGGGGGGRAENWTQDRGLQKGVEALNRARVAYGKEGEGVREFAKLVLQVVGREGREEEEGGKDDVIEREIAEENARVISMLLSREMAR